jgi:uncharacterized protein YbjT (DUF2867 family)
VVVAGASGRFGGICEVLLVRGHAVRALTRTPTSATADRLRAAGVEVVTGDFDQPTTLSAAMGGVDAVFASGTLHKAGPEGELRHGRNIADAAEVARVPHLVYVSGADAVTTPGVPVFEIKAAVEHHLASLDLPTTIVAPVYFMENLFNPWNLEGLRAGKVAAYLSPERSVQQVAIADVIQFAVIALESADRFAGRRVEIASDAVTAQQTAAILTRAAGRPFVVEQASPAALGPGLSALFNWLDGHGHNVDIADLHSQYPQVIWHSFEEWAEGQSWRAATAECEAAS